MPHKKRPNGTWEDIENIRVELDKLSRKLGRFPTGRELRDAGLSGMLRRIEQDFGGIHEVRADLRYEPGKERPKKYWKNPENLRRELTEIEQEIGHFPDKGDLTQLGRQDVMNAVAKYYGGMAGVRKLLGAYSERKDHGYWKNPDNLNREVVEFMTKHKFNTLPSSRKMRELGEAGIATAIDNHHGGFRVFRKEMEGRELRKSRVYLKDKKKLLKEIRDLIKTNKWERLPTFEELTSQGYDYIARYICKYGGGFPQIRRKLGEENVAVSRGTWQDKEYCIQTVIDVMKGNRLDYIPGPTYLGKKGYSGLLGAVSQKHGGFPGFREEVQRRLEMNNESLLEQYVGGKLK